jgi:hypothetical protein
MIVPAAIIIRRHGTWSKKDRCMIIILVIHLILQLLHHSFSERRAPCAFFFASYLAFSRSTKSSCVGMSINTKDRGVGGTYTAGLKLPVDEGAGKASEDLLGLGVAVGLAVLSDVVLVGLRSLRIQISRARDGLGKNVRAHLICGSARNDLVRELGLVVRVRKLLVLLSSLRLVGFVVEEAWRWRVRCRWKIVDGKTYPF